MSQRSFELPVLGRPEPVDHAAAAAAFNADVARTEWHDDALWFIREKRDRAAGSVADWEELRERASAIKEHALSHLDGLTPLGALVFNCAGRRAGLIEGGLDEELAVLRKGLRDAPFAGFYTTGEIARVRGASGMHHLTLVTLALA